MSPPKPRDDDNQPVTKGQCRRVEHETWKWLWRWLAIGGLIISGLGTGVYYLMGEVFSAQRAAASATQRAIEANAATKQYATEASGELKAIREGNNEYRTAVKDALGRIDKKLESIDLYLRDRGRK